MTPTVLVFDLDGTLVDTKHDLANALNAVLAQEGHTPVSTQSLGHLFGHGARALLRKGLELNGVAAPDSALLDRLQPAFLDHYRANIAVESHPFPGAVDAMAALRARGFRIAVCTNKTEALARQLLDTLGLSAAIDAFVGGDTYARSKPNAEPVLGAISRAGGQPARAVMIGDSKTDVDAARAACIPVIAVTFGYASVPVADLSPDAIISAFQTLPETLAALGLTP
ncbi:HAD family hydrolase [Stappia sp. ES.058]|uniref:HAD family hydrolase n=1 Tax=Stappia sp. ES.058 TaxID=1881061 RepID=UPI00087C5D08|nr:HAD family hydrolase [Stappia sp. ES.058]SDU15192.1 phosphoglycolate phosphatase [Stappia sp. ES.058]